METKVCTKCGRELPLSEYSKNKKSLDGLCSSCKGCQKKYREENSEHIKKYRIKNSESMKKKNKEYYQAHKEKYLKETTKEERCQIDKEHYRKYNGNMKICRINNIYNPVFKACTKCRILKPIKEFGKNQCSCKACRKSLATKYSKACSIKITHKVYFIACSKCGKLNTLSGYYNSNKKDRTCKDCKKAYATKFSECCYIENEHPIFFKACTKCKKVKHISNFSNDGSYSSCKSCVSKDAAHERAVLGRRYIRGLLLTAGFKPQDITNGLITIKRSQLKLNKAIKAVRS